MVGKSVELETAEALLDIGVSVPFKDIKIPFIKKPLQLRFTMRRPCLGNQFRIARHYLKLGVTYDEMKAFTKDQEMQFLAEHGCRVCKMLSLMICRGFFSGWLLSPVVVFLIRWFVDDGFLFGANLRYVCLLSTKNFTPIIRSTEATNPLKPKLSQQKRKGS